MPELIQPKNITPTKSSNFLIVTLSILLLIAIFFTGFFAFQTKRLTKQLAQYQSANPTPSATPIVNAKCVEKSSLNCAEEPELSFECTEEYQNWAKTNCSGWEERVYCQDPRPEVCTMECLENPPYICGSDGKSHCSICQACSNENVVWYEIKTSPCEEGQFCGGITGIICPEGYSCKYDGNYPDASGVCTKLTEPISAISESELSLGWYWGSSSQKKPGTPTDWVFSGSGSRSDCWHKPDTPCTFSPD